MTDNWETEGGLVLRVRLWTSKAWLRKKYVVEKLSEQEIAELANTNQSTINRWLRNFELK